MKKEVRYFAQDGENIFYLSSSVCAVLSLNSQHNIIRNTNGRFGVSFFCHQTEYILKYSNQLQIKVILILKSVECIYWSQ